MQLAVPGYSQGTLRLRSTPYWLRLTRKSYPFPPGRRGDWVENSGGARCLAALGLACLTTAIPALCGVAAPAREPSQRQAQAPGIALRHRARRLSLFAGMSIASGSGPIGTARLLHHRAWGYHHGL
ncbi:hypothetical protein VTN02DRAFT_1127 [Thermoascus thermophilus]